MSSIFTLRDETYNLFAAMLFNKTGKLPVITAKIRWTQSQTWTLKFPLNYTSMKTGRDAGQDVFNHMWVVEKGVDKSIHVNVTGSKFDERGKGVMYQYRPSNQLIASDIYMLIQLIKTTNFKIDIRDVQSQELLETGQFSPEDCLSVRCMI